MSLLSWARELMPRNGRGAGRSGGICTQPPAAGMPWRARRYAVALGAIGGGDEIVFRRALRPGQGLSTTAVSVVATMLAPEAVTAFTTSASREIPARRQICHVIRHAHQAETSGFSASPTLVMTPGMYPWVGRLTITPSRPQRGVRLEHRLVWFAQRRQLVEVVHHQDRVESGGLGLLRFRRHGREEFDDRGAVGEVGNL